MSPLTFIKRPVAWVEAMTRYKATHVQSPNFGLKLTARKWAEEAAATRARGGLKPDLSSLRHIFNAAEPVTLGAMRDFMHAFGPFGLLPQVGGETERPVKQSPLALHPFSLSALCRHFALGTAWLSTPCT